MSTNLTSLSALPLQSSPRSLCALRSLMYPSLILLCKSPSPLYINHKVWIVLIVWKSSHLFSTSNTTLSWPDLWIKFTFISAKVPCHNNCLACTRVCVSKYFKNILSTPWSYATPNSVITSSNNALWQKNWSFSLTIVELFALILWEPKNPRKSGLAS